MQVLVLYLATAIVFLAADAVALRVLLKPLFDSHLGDWLLESPRMVPAVIFYLFFIAGLLVLVSWPALRADDPTWAFVGGAVFGAVAYGTYEFTNFATLRLWSMQQVIIDTAWGTGLTAVSAWAGVVITRALIS